MLKLLNVKNFALLEDVTIDFEPGLTVVTGETGAGKSMIVEAVSTLCGNRLEDLFIRTNKNYAEVTGVLTVTPELESVIKQAGMECNSEVVIRRRTERGKRQTTYINDHISSLNLLGNLIGNMIDLIGQYENQSLFFARNHRALLDSYAGLEQTLTSYGARYAEYRKLKTRLQELEDAARTKKDRIDHYTYQIQEIEKAKIEPGEQEKLEQERKLLSTSEKRSHLSGIITDHLYEQEGSVIEQLSKVKEFFDELSVFDPDMKEHCKEIETILTSIDELHRDLSVYRNSIDFSKERLDDIQLRIETIRSIQKKYGPTIEEVTRRLTTLKKGLQELEHRDEMINSTRHRIQNSEQELNAQAKQLRRKRKDAARSLERAILGKLKNLGMKKARFEIRLTPCPLNEYGTDDVEFFISTNPGEHLKPLRKIASGGEISRITLSLKTILSEADKIPTIIFDEVDIGIGGSVAEAVGDLLAALSKNHQVICVTHLPQISVFADTHILVYKEIKGKETFTRATKLDDTKRQQEIARMLGGKDITKKTMEHAAEFLKKGQTR